MRVDSAAEHASLISVIIGTKNRREVLLRNLQRLRECTYKQLEVIVVDDGSTDGTAEAVSELLPPPRVVRLDESVGPGLARNAGMALAKGEYFFIMDDDAYVEPGAFEKMLKVFAEDAQTAAITFRITSLLDGSVDTRDYTQPYCKSILTIATGIRAHAARRVGGFTPLSVFHGDEFDYSVRLIDHRYKIRYAPEIQAFHEAVGHRRRFPVGRLVYIGNWILIFFDLFPAPTAALFSARAITSFALRSVRERSCLPFLKGLFHAGWNLAAVLRHRRLVSPETVALCLDPNLLPDTYNVPVLRKARNKISLLLSAKNKKTAAGVLPRMQRSNSTTRL